MFGTIMQQIMLSTMKIMLLKCCTTLFYYFLAVNLTADTNPEGLVLGQHVDYC